VVNKYAAYIRVSDKNKSDGSAQRNSIQEYAEKKGITISIWVEEFASASKTDVEERELNDLVKDGFSIIMTDTTRLGRRKVFELLGVIGKICKKASLHFTYTDKVIDSSNMDDAEIIFTVIGQSFAAVEESKSRSNRAKAAHQKRKAQGLSSGRTVGQVVKSKIDEHSAFIINELEKKTSKVKILKMLEDKGTKVSRSVFYTWMEKRRIK